jgi:hypothetical protein
MEKQLIDLGCGWCHATSKCSMRKDCPIAQTIINNVEQKLNWMSDLTGPNSYCSNPTVHSMTPKCGPRVGAGTRIELNGQNLGYSTRDIRVKMKPISTSSSTLSNSNYMVRQDLDCDILDEFYLKAKRIVCKTQPILYEKSLYDYDEKYSIYVQTNVNYPLGVYSSLNNSNQFVFDYVTPQVFAIEPRKGIKSGGTILKITGKHLSCGSDLKFILGTLFLGINNSH